MRGAALGFDTFGETGVTFISHAGVRLPRRPGRMILSSVTAALLGKGASQALATPPGRRFSLGRLELELLPSGVAPGATALLVSVEGQRLLYAGELGSGPALGCGERPRARRCHHLVLRPHFDGARDVLPPPQETFDELCDLLRDARTVGEVPVLRGRALGRLLALPGPLVAAGFRVRAHRRIHRHLGILREVGLPVERVPRFEGRATPGEILLWPRRAPPPPHGSGTALRHVLVSGRALRPEAAGEAGCALGVPLSARADLPALVAYVKACGPEVVSLTRAPSAAFRSALERLGVRWKVVGPPAQLSMFDAS